MILSNMCSIRLRDVRVAHAVRCVVVDISTVHDGRGASSFGEVTEVIVLLVAVGCSVRHSCKEVRGIERVGIRAFMLLDNVSKLRYCGIQALVAFSCHHGRGFFGSGEL